MGSNNLVATAYHEAGHVVANWKLGFKVRSVSIVPTEDSAGHVLLVRRRHPEFDITMMSTQMLDFHRRVVALFAGVEAQRYFNPRSARRYHAKSDIAAINDLLSRIHANDEKEAFYAFKYLQARARNFV